VGGEVMSDTLAAYAEDILAARAIGEECGIIAHSAERVAIELRDRLAAAEKRAEEAERESDTIAAASAALTARIDGLEADRERLRGLLREVCEDSTAYLIDPDKRLWPIRSNLYRRIRAAIAGEPAIVCPKCGGPTSHDRSDPPNSFMCDDCAGELAELCCQNKDRRPAEVMSCLGFGIIYRLCPGCPDCLPEGGEEE